MDVGFAEAGSGDADEARFLSEFFDGVGTDVAHAGFEATDELVGESGKRTFVSNPPFDTFGDGLTAFGAFLRIAIGGACFHGAGGTHAAIRLESTTLIENGFAGSFFGAGEEAANHNGAGAGGDSFGDVSRIFDAAIGDDGDVGAFGSARGFHDGGELRNTGTGDDAGGADGARTDTDLQAINSQRD